MVSERNLYGCYVNIGILAIYESLHVEKQCHTDIITEQPMTDCTVRTVECNKSCSHIVGNLYSKKEEKNAVF